MAVYKDGDTWRYRTKVALAGPLPPRPDGKPRSHVERAADGTLRHMVRVSGTPTINTERAAERAERDHVQRVEQEATIAKYAPTTLEVRKVPTLAEWFRGDATGDAEYTGRFWTEHARGEKENRAGTLAEKRRTFERHLEPSLGHLPLDQIDLGVVNALRAELQTKLGRCKEPLSAKTRVNILAILSTALRYAEDAGVIERAPRIKIKVPPPPEIEVLDFEAYGRMLAAALREGEPWATAVLLAGEAGLRIGEVLALEWPDLDLVANTITVARQVRREIVGPTKGGKPRAMPMTPRLAAHLRSVPRIHVGRVVAHVAGEPMTEGLAKHGIYRVCRAAGLPERSWHVLRHSFATHAALLGANPLRLQQWLGHSTLTMTLRYVHFAEAHAWPIADEVLTAGADILHPDRRVIAQLGTRPLVDPRAKVVPNENARSGNLASSHCFSVAGAGFEPATFGL